MVELYVFEVILYILFNVFNAIKLSKSQTKVEELFYSSLTTFSFLIVASIDILISYMSKNSLFSVPYIDILILLVINIMFIIVNGFILITKSLNDNSKSKLLFGFFIMIAFPVHMLLSLPILVIICILKYKDYNDHKINICEEEILDLEFNSEEIDEDENEDENK